MIYRTHIILGALILFVLSGASAHAQDRQILSVTPPLFQLNALPGDIWQSSVKVVNGNLYPLTVYTEVVNFEPIGEGGQGKFVPVLNATPDKTTLAEWIEVNSGPHIIDPEQTKDVPFFVEIPKDASPGGHYAAILVSTAPQSADENVVVQTSQSVTSLFFVRVEGDVDESATIREFTVKDAFVDTPSAEFEMRFENKGNVHLQPRGDIIITNMWGTERGTIPVNYQSHFGNVLPHSIRAFNFAWKSDFKLSDIGRYKAEVTLAYGLDGVKSTTAVAYFWVIPVKGTLITLFIAATFISLIVLMVKAYVRKMLALAGVEPVQKAKSAPLPEEILTLPKKRRSLRTVAAPLEHGVLDLRSRLKTTNETAEVLKTAFGFVMQYKVFFISVLTLILIFVTVVMYFSSATDENQNYEVTITEGEHTTKLEVDPAQ